MAWFGKGYWALVGRRISLAVVNLVGAWYLTGWKPGLYVRADGLGPLIRFAVHSFGVQGLSTLRRNFDKMLLGWWSGVGQVGNYDRAQQLFVVPFNQLAAPLTDVVVVTLSRLRGDPPRFRRYFLEVVRFMAFAGMGFSVVLTVVGRDLVIAFVGEQWREAGVVLTVFGPGVGMFLLLNSLIWLHYSRGERIGHLDGTLSRQ